MASEHYERYKDSIKKANQKYTGEGSQNKDIAKVESIRLRVPKGWGQKMKEYVANSKKYKSVNGMICDLIRKEIDIDEK